MRVCINPFSFDRLGEVHDIDIIIAILIKVFNHLDDPRIILQDPHLLELRLNLLLLNSRVIRRLLKELEYVIDALKLLLIVSNELEECLQEPRLQPLHLIGVVLLDEHVKGLLDADDMDLVGATELVHVVVLTLPEGRFAEPVGRALFHLEV